MPGCPWKELGWFLQSLMHQYNRNPLLGGNHVIDDIGNVTALMFTGFSQVCYCAQEIQLDHPLLDPKNDLGRTP